MSVIKRLGAKKFTASQMSKEDIDVLALICKFCAPIVEKGFGPFKKVYAYYIPQYESDFDIAQNIFNKNGVTTEIHKSRIINIFGENVLRMNYDLCENPKELYESINKIDTKYVMLYTPSFKQERFNINQKLSELRQIQK